MQLVKFFSVGIVQLAIDTSVLYLLMHFCDVKLEFANVISRALAALIGCYLNYLYTFSQSVKSGIIITYFKFWLFWGGMTFLSSFAMRELFYLFSGVISLHGYLVIIIKLTVETGLFVLSYYISKFWVFRRKYE